MKNGFGFAEDIVPFLHELFPDLSDGNKVLVAVLYSALFLFFILIARVLLKIISNHIAKKAFKIYLSSLNILKDINDLEISEEEKKSLRDLISACAKLGADIDFHTDRINHSRKVSRLVSKMCTFLRVPKLEGILNTCASMIYDIGFLDIDAELFQAEILDQKEKQLLKTHINSFLPESDFIPEAYKTLFVFAINYHHENFDGSGYPEGLKEKDIPSVARMIRAAESYVSMTSKRSYHKTLSREKAIKNLKKAGVYDMEIVGALEHVTKNIRGKK